ncbi:MAG: choice-of-anchor L domain-containing protein [Sporichthyaceae bacterium]
MSRFRGSRRRALASAAALAVGSSIALAPHASAAVDAGVTNDQLIAALSTPFSYITAINQAVPPGSGGNSIGVYTQDAPGDQIGGLPLSGSSFAILSTGRADHLEFGPNPNGSGFSAVAVRGGFAYDLSSLEIALDLPRGTNCLTFDFRYLTDEWDQIAHGYNDAFVAEMDASTWTTANTPKGIKVVSHDNFAVDPADRQLTTHKLGKSEWITAAAAAGTSYNGATPLLRAAAPTTPGKHRLYLSVFDLGDRFHDTAVIVDNLRATRSTECLSGVTPLPVR